jgi:hypothetical protein
MSDNRALFAGETITGDSEAVFTGRANGILGEAQFSIPL